ncbi:MAG: DUF5677 domain-containing protein [Chloroflexota bacterium]|nr:DUF5677 domain-containing protein [Chloroflexota bacterium]
MTSSNDLLARSFSLADTLMGNRVGIQEKDLGEQWPTVVVFHLLRIRQATLAIRIILEEDLCGPAIVLCRYTFELAVNLRYLQLNVDERLPKYLEHSGIMESVEKYSDIKQRAELFSEQEDYVGLSKLLIPDRSWKNLRSMCEEIGCLDLYFTMYRGSSELAHSGAHGMGTEILELMGRQPMPDYEPPGIIVSALVYYCWVVEISCETLPYLSRDIGVNDDWVREFNLLQSDISIAARRHEFG